MSADLESTSHDREAWAAIRTLIVPPDIVAVSRQPAAARRMNTPWRPHADGAQETARGGGREWFSDNLFVDAEPRHRRAGYGTSLVAHTGGTIALVAMVWLQPSQTPLVRTDPALVMPVTLSMPPVLDVAPLASSPAPSSPMVERTVPKPEARPAEPPPPAPIDEGVPAPVDAPSAVAPETGAESAVNGVGGGGSAGAANGVPGGVFESDRHGGAAVPGLVRAGSGIRPPRKIKDAKPVYPQAALSERARGTVILEITIGTSGTVQDLKVVHSVPLFDQAALDAVRQWEYEPSMLNGAPVAVMVTVVLTFAIQ